MSADLDLSTRINLRSASVLVIDANAQALDMMRQILIGFGVQSVHVCDDIEDARRLFRQQTLELVIVDPLFAGADGFDLIRQMRREEAPRDGCVPIIAALGHLTLANVEAARDSGANFVVAKPLSAEVLLRRIGWVARTNRPFIVSPNYVGPDRRFKNQGPPIGTAGRRANDLPLEVPAVSEPNMSQNEVDELLKPRRIAV